MGICISAEVRQQAAKNEKIENELSKESQPIKLLLLGEMLMGFLMLYIYRIYYNRSPLLLFFRQSFGGASIKGTASILGRASIIYGNRFLSGAAASGKSTILKQMM